MGETSMVRLGKENQLDGNLGNRLKVVQGIGVRNFIKQADKGIFPG